MGLTAIVKKCGAAETEHTALTEKIEVHSLAVSQKSDAYRNSRIFQLTFQSVDGIRAVLTVNPIFVTAFKHIRTERIIAFAVRHHESPHFTEIGRLSVIHRIIKQHRLVPVPVKSKIRNRKCGYSFLFAFKENKAVKEVSVFESFFHSLTKFGRQGNCKSNFRL